MLLFAAFATSFVPEAEAGSGYHVCRGKNGTRTFTNLPCNKQNTSGIAGPRDVFYKSRTPGGAIEFSSKPPIGRSYVAVEVGGCPACRLDSSVNWTATRLNLTDYAATIAAAAAEHGVDQSIVRAIIHAESAFNPEALSRKGAQGLMQLMPGTAGQYGVTNAFDPEQNIKAGVRHLAGLLKRYDGDLKLVAAAYNAG
ncbi:MAG TPA: lytic transglycosylase domain-containing protein, partial [Burkholderiaceae bacterium]|nr:lytic transglycosylase domain-containing protein [Burkholderiaceae bacterium]